MYFPSLVSLIFVIACFLCVVICFPTNNHHKQPEGYFQYINVPGHKEYEFGWNRGNPHHYISRFEQAKDHMFRTRVKWHDNKEGYGEHYWEYNHAPKHPYGHEDHHGGYAPDHKVPHDVYKPPHDVYKPPKGYHDSI